MADVPEHDSQGKPTYDIHEVIGCFLGTAITVSVFLPWLMLIAYLLLPVLIPGLPELVPSIWGRD